MALTGNPAFQASRARQDAQGARDRRAAAANRGAAGSKAKADTKVVTQAARTGGRSAAGAVAKDAAGRAKSGGAAKPRNVLPKRPGQLGKDTGPGPARLQGAAHRRGPGIPGRGDPRRLLLAQFLVCLTVLGLGTVVAPRGSKDGVPRLMVRATALSALFLILALVSSAGTRPAKAAAGLGALVAVTYLVGSSDATDIFTWASRYFTHEGTGGAGLAAQGGLGSGGAAGSVGEVIGAGAGVIGGVYGAGAAGSAGEAIGQGAGSLGGYQAPPANPGGGNKSGLL